MANWSKLIVECGSFSYNVMLSSSSPDDRTMGPINTNEISHTFQHTMGLLGMITVTVTTVGTTSGSPSNAAAKAYGAYLCIHVYAIVWNW